ncbi:MAG: type II toxin-antitoxin system RelE/ParE family toxin [Massilia sp.]
MDVNWTSKALSDLARLHDFLAAVNKTAAARSVRTLTAAVGRLASSPRTGEKLDEFAPSEVRRLLVGQYEIRYEIRNSLILTLRIWHTREER